MENRARGGFQGEWVCLFDVSRVEEEGEEARLLSWLACLGWSGVLRGDLKGLERALVLAMVEGPKRRRLGGG